MTEKRDNQLKHEQRIAKKWCEELCNRHGIAAWPDTLRVSAGDTEWRSAMVALTWPTGKRLWVLVAIGRELNSNEVHAISQEARIAHFADFDALCIALNISNHAR